MASITFDTLELMERLKQSGLPAEQSEAIVRSIIESQHSLVTEDVLDKKLFPVKSDLLVVKWMLAVVIVATVIPTFTRFVS
ncbi:MAG: hypothetical protein RI556_07150 [Hydrogenovibrio sp.]|uniref:hypothetical protein n=1 Tax=Hydrogenovibrio sp. TaxID=2065821 RepID=UPI00286FE655|nr:hypothetical protein [Hydrogenovibrio sp.]MDR9498935.1 hypothetical protein [Hydrogenovibrio sp.]